MFKKKATYLTLADAASDAYAAVQLYAILNHERQNLDSVPPLPHYAELDLPITLPAAVVKKKTRKKKASPKDTSLEAEKDLGDQTASAAEPAIESVPEDETLGSEVNIDDQTTPIPEPPVQLDPQPRPNSKPTPGAKPNP